MKHILHGGCWQTVPAGVVRRLARIFVRLCLIPGNFNFFLPPKSYCICCPNSPTAAAFAAPTAQQPMSTFSPSPRPGVSRDLLKQESYFDLAATDLCCSLLEETMGR